MQAIKSNRFICLFIYLFVYFQANWGPELTLTLFKETMTDQKLQVSN